LSFRRTPESRKFNELDPGFLRGDKYFSVSLGPSGKSHLPPCFKYRHGNRVGKIQAALPRSHGQAQALAFGEFVHHLSGQAARFPAENKDIIVLEFWRVIRLSAACRHGKASAAGQRRRTGVPVGVPENPRKLMVIKASSLERTVFPAKAKRFDQMQIGTRIGAQPYDVARIRRNFRLKQNDSNQN